MKYDALIIRLGQAGNPPLIGSPIWDGLWLYRRKRTWVALHQRLHAYKTSPSRARASLRGNRRALGRQRFERQR